MGRGIVKLDENKFVEWSTIVDAPISSVFSMEAGFDTYGRERMERANESGTSYRDEESNQTFFDYNRAGEGESHISREMIVERYTKCITCDRGFYTHRFGTYIKHQWVCAHCTDSIFNQELHRVNEIRKANRLPPMVLVLRPS